MTFLKKGNSPMKRPSLSNRTKMYKMIGSTDIGRMLNSVITSDEPGKDEVIREKIVRILAAQLETESPTAVLTRFTKALWGSHDGICPLCIGIWAWASHEAGKPKRGKR